MPTVGIEALVKVESGVPPVDGQSCAKPLEDIENWVTGLAKKFIVKGSGSSAEVASSATVAGTGVAPTIESQAAVMTVRA